MLLFQFDISARSGCHDVDVHFMDFGPCEVDEKFIYDLIRTSEQSHVYWFLQKSEVRSKLFS